MKEKVCTFIGHSKLWGKKAELEPLIYEKLKELIVNCEVDTFYNGGMGEFDLLCASVVRKLKREYSIRLILVIPYMTKEINDNCEFYYSQYDDIIRPEELMGVHYKAAITRRNRWMADNSSYAICYVNDKNGGAYKTLTYAKKTDIRIINFADEQ